MEHGNNSHKEALKEKVERHAGMIRDEVSNVSSRADEFIKTALMIGGSVALGYMIVRQLTGKRKTGLLNTLLMSAASGLATTHGRKLLTTVAGKVNQVLNK